MSLLVTKCQMKYWAHTGWSRSSEAASLLWNLYTVLYRLPAVHSLWTNALLKRDPKWSKGDAGRKPEKWWRRIWQGWVELAWKGLTHKEIQTASLYVLCQLYHHALWIWKNICLRCSHSAEESGFLTEAEQPTAECRLSCASKGHLRKTKISQRLEPCKHHLGAAPSTVAAPCVSQPRPSVSRKNLWLQLGLSLRNGTLGHSKDTQKGQEYADGMIMLREAWN